MLIRKKHFAEVLVDPILLNIDKREFLRNTGWFIANTPLFHIRIR